METEKKKVLDFLRITPHAQIVDVCFATGVYWDDVQTCINELLSEGALKMRSRKRGKKVFVWYEPAK